MLPKVPSVFDRVIKHWLQNRNRNVDNGIVTSAFSSTNSRIGSNNALLSLFPTASAICTSRKSSTLGIGTGKEDERKIMLRKWLEMCRYEGESVPDRITDEEFENLLKTPTISQRYKYLSKLWRKETFAKTKPERLAQMREVIRTEGENRLQMNTAGHLRYGLWNNTMFAKISSQFITDLQHHRLVSAIKLSQSIILDLGFESYMTPRELTVLTHEVIHSMHMNRKNSEPFNLIVCNANLDSKVVHKLGKLFSKSLPMMITPKSYLELFPKEKLVYLSPDARAEVTKFDPTAVYIIGGIVEVSRKDPLSLAKAKREALTAKKLPLDRYCLFKRHKSLNLPLVTSILLDVQKTGNWKQAFENIPKTFLFSDEERKLSAELKQKKYRRRKR